MQALHFPVRPCGMVAVGGFGEIPHLMLATSIGEDGAVDMPGDPGGFSVRRRGALP